jgi:hypothetical protein
MQAQSTLALSALRDGSHRRREPALLRRLMGARPGFKLHGVGAPRRAELETYIARCFDRAYQAEVTEFAPLLLEQYCAGGISGVAGIRPAAREPLFFEQYLDEPVERVATRVAGAPICRAELVEMCNLAALRPGACQLINILLAAVLHDAGFRYAGFAGTAQLEKIVRKQNFSVHPVAVADPEKLGAAAAQWGSYYDSSPNVLLVDLRKTLSTLRQQRLPAAVFSFYAAEIQELAASVRAVNRTAGRAHEWAQ